MTGPLSVIIAARNAEETIRDQVVALMAQAWPHGGEIIVADNGSTDATPEIVASEARDLDPALGVSIRVVACQNGIGAGYARNVGVRESRYENIAFCDADDVVAPGWVEAMGSALARHCAVGGKLEVEKLNPPNVVQSRGTGLSGDELPSFDGVFPVLSSCNLGIRRTTFDELGGFDEAYLRGQDAELSMRLFDRGIDPHFASDAVVHYRLQTSSGAIFRQACGWGEVNGRLRSRLKRHPRWRTSLRSWIWLGVHVRDLTSTTKRARWVYVAGLRTGLVINALRRRLGKVHD